MSKLTRKFLIGITTVLVVVVGISLYLNTNFIQRYFLYQEKKELSEICNQILDFKENDIRSLKNKIERIEQKKDVVIALTNSTENNEQLNEQIRQAFLEKGISLKKYWLWEEDQQKAMEQGQKMRVYHQEKLHYSILANYISKGNIFIAAVKIIPSIERTLNMINQVTILVFVGAIVVMTILILILVHKIISPLQQIGETAKAISTLDFKKIELHTGDELEQLADNINDMSQKLKESHERLEEKNRQMEELLANVSHDLKTPISLIKAYANGIQDGIDDGTFLDTIIEQNRQMEQMVIQLLDRAKMKQQKDNCIPLNLSECLRQQIKSFQIKRKERNLSFNCNIEDKLFCNGNEKVIQMIFSNLISNAVKYSKGRRIDIHLYKAETGCIFSIQNEIDLENNIDIKIIWEPFYVSEQSRNKEKSGTGLGLSIVKTICEKYGYFYECRKKDEKIQFHIYIINRIGQQRE